MPPGGNVESGAIGGLWRGCMGGREGGKGLTYPNTAMMVTGNKGVLMKGYRADTDVKLEPLQLLHRVQIDDDYRLPPRYSGVRFGDRQTIGRFDQKLEIP